MKKNIFFVILLSLISSGCSSNGTTSNGSGSGTIGTDTFDADVSDGLAPASLPTVTQTDDTTFNITCAEGATTAYGLAEISCSDRAYYVACDCGEIVFGYNTTGSASNLGCSSVNLSCDATGWPIESSSDCSASSASITGYANGTVASCNDTGGDSGTPSTQTENGTLDHTDSYTNNASPALYYDTYSFSAEAGQTVTIDFQTTSTQFLGPVVLVDEGSYDEETFNTDPALAKETVSYGDTAVSTNYTFTETGTYIIVVSAYLIYAEDLSEIESLDYTITWTVE